MGLGFSSWTGSSETGSRESTSAERAAAARGWKEKLRPRGTRACGSQDLIPVPQDVQSHHSWVVSGLRLID